MTVDAVVRRRLRRALLALLVIALIWVSLSHILGAILISVFSEGTGSVVTARNAKIGLFPLRASIEDVSFSRPGEPEGGGLRSKRISLTLSPSWLFKKRVVIDSLRIEETFIASADADSSFIKLLEFLFAKKKKAAPPAWLAPIVGGWFVIIPEVVVETATDTALPLTIGTEDFVIQAERARFVANDQIEPPTLPVRVRLDAEGATVIPADEPARRLGDVHITGLIGGGRIAFHQAVATLDRGRAGEGRRSELSLQGDLLLGDEPRFALTYAAVLFDQTLVQLLDPARSDSAEAAAALIGDVSGLLEAPRIAAQLSFRGEARALSPALPACTVEDLSGAVTLTSEQLLLSGLAVPALLERGEVALALDGERQLDGSFTLPAGSAAVLLERCGSALPAEAPRLVKAPLEGTVRGTVEPRSLELSLATADESAALFSASLRLEENEVVLELRDRSQSTGAGGITGSSLELLASLSLPPTALTIERLRFERYAPHQLLSFAAIAAPRVEATLEPLLTSETRIDADLKGGVELAALESSTAEGRFKISGLDLGLKDAAAVSGTLALDGEGVTLKPLSLALQDEPVLSGSLRLAKSAAIEGRFETSDLDLSRLIELPPALAGSVDAEASLGGSLSSPTLSARAELETSFRRGSVLRSTVSLAADPERLALDASLLEGRAELEARYPGPASADEELTVAFKAVRFPLDYFETGRPDGGNRLTAALSYRAKRSAPLQGSGTLRVSEMEMAAGGLSIDQQEPLIIAIADGRAALAPTALLIGGESITLSGSVSSAEGWDASVRGALSLGKQIVPADFIEQISGRLELNLSIVGPLAAPAIFGEASLRNGSVSFPVGQTVMGAEEVEIDVQFDEKSVETTRMFGRMSGGTVVGVLSLHEPFEADSRRLSTELRFDAVRIEPFPNTTMRFEGALRVTQDGARPLRVSADVFVLDALYEDTVELATLLALLTRKIVGEPAAATADQGPPVALDVRIRADNNVVVDTNLAKAELKGDVRLTGTSQAPLAAGSVSVIDGVFGTQGREFEIVAGELTFSPAHPPFDPALDIVGETAVTPTGGDEQQVRMIVQGRVSDPRITFSSDGDLSEDEIVAMLGSAGDMGGLTLLGETRSEHTFRELISPTSNVSLRDRLSGLTGFRQVEVATGLSPQTGEFVPKVVATRPLRGEMDLTIESELAGEQNSELRVRYPLTPYLSLLGGWTSAPSVSDVNDSSGAFGVGVRYRVTFPGLLFWRGKSSKASFE